MAITVYEFDLTRRLWKVLKTRYVSFSSNVAGIFPINECKILIHLERPLVDKFQLIDLNDESCSIGYFKLQSVRNENILDVPKGIIGMDEEDISFIRVSKTTIIVISYYVFLQGTLTNDVRGIAWSSTYTGKMWIRTTPVCFKLKDNIYIAGRYRYCNNPRDRTYNVTSSFCDKVCKGCDIYNYKTRKLYLNIHSLPYALCKSSAVRVATNKNEDIAVLVLTVLGVEKMLIFTHEEGFIEPKGYEKLPSRYKQLECNALIWVDN